MSGWLRNLQGQLTELASEVLNEATEETSDPESELQVITKKLTETESQLANEQRKTEELLKKTNDLEEQLFAKNVEIDAVTTKYTHIIESRDSQIRSLQVDIERLRNSNDSSVVLLDEDDEDGLLTDSNKRTERLKDQIEELRKEVAHWKRIVNESLNADHSRRIAELECKLGEQKSKSEAEMAALVLAHNENIAHLRSEYESKFSRMSHQVPGQQTLNTTLQQSKAEDSDDWQNAWDDVDNLSLPTFTVEEDPTLELQKEQKDLKQKLESITKELNEERMKNKVISDEVDRLALQAVDSVLNDQLQNIKDENENLRIQLKNCNDELHASNGEVEKLILKLDSANAEIHFLRDKYEKEVKLSSNEDRLVLGERVEEIEQLRIDSVPPSSMRTNRHLSIENAETISVQTPEPALNENSSDKDKELEKLRRENNELTMAYNDLNEEFENHKAEHGSVLISNRDLTDRIDALKANLIEYEERYELCKAENAETVQQLEKLTNDFERLRQSFEASSFRPASETPSDEVERLRMELESSRDERERLRSDVSRFRTAVGAIDLELNSLRESNERLARDNMAMGRNLDRFIDIREMLERSDCELKSLRDKFIELQMEHREKENTWKRELVAITGERDNAQKALDECRTRCTETESALQRYRCVTNEGRGSYEFMEMKTETVQTGSSEEGTTDSNSGWEKMNEWDASTVIAAANATTNNAQNGNNPLVEELKEALEMVTEKTEECEELRRQKCEIEKEFELRQTYIEELMAQTNALQLQQQTQADAFSEVRERANKMDCEKLEMERNLIQMTEQLEDSTRKMDALKDENMKLENLLKESESVSHSHDKEISAEVDELKKRLAENEKHHQDELTNQKYQYEEQLRELSEEKRSLDGRVEVLEEQLIKERQSLESASELQRSCKEELANIKEEKVELLKRIELLNNELADVKSSVQQLNIAPVVNTEDMDKMREEISTLQQSLKVAEEKCETFKTDNIKLSDDLRNMKTTLAEAENVRNELVTLVEQKHTESVQYHSQLQVLLTEKEEIDAKLKTSLQQIENLENQIASCKEARDKCLRECDRLREHLMTIEESSTREAVIAEERETELRKRIRELEQKTEATEDSVIQSANSYQQQISQLSDEVDRLRHQKEEASTLLASRERTLADTQKALSNLQTVVRDLGFDHAVQLTQYDQQLNDLKAEISTLEKDMEASKKKEEMLILEKQVLEDSAVHLKEELSRRDIVIEELEAQIDERGVEKGGGGPSSSSSSSYQIDDETLRQLFLSYFTAEKDKQPDIAMLMASVLGYSQEDVAKIQAANQSSSRGWFGFSNSSRSSATQNSVSITEQFIRFLEKESIAASASHSLPLTKSDNNNKSTMRSSITIPATQSSLPDELRDLVES